MELIKPYTGPLKNPNDMPEGPIKQAYISWREQRTRCYNKKRKTAKTYHNKKIEVRYSSRDFIGWWCEKIKDFDGDQPTIGRIDHDGHYEFENVEIQSRSENASERCRRVPPWKTPKKIFIYNKYDTLLCVAASINAAARITGKTLACVFHSANAGYMGSRSGYRFRYENNKHGFKPISWNS